jgi:hypothetical protein
MNTAHAYNRLQVAIRIADRLQALKATADFAASLTADQRHGASISAGNRPGYQPDPATWALVVEQLRNRERCAATPVRELVAG